MWDTSSDQHFRTAHMLQQTSIKIMTEGTEERRTAVYMRNSSSDIATDQLLRTNYRWNVLYM